MRFISLRQIKQRAMMKSGSGGTDGIETSCVKNTSYRRAGCTKFYGSEDATVVIAHH